LNPATQNINLNPYGSYGSNSGSGSGSGAEFNSNIKNLMKNEVINIDNN